MTGDSPNAIHQAEVPPTAEGERLDKFIGHALGVSRARLKELFDARGVRLDGRPAKKGDRVKAGQRVEVALPSQGEPVVPDPSAPLNVLWQDEALIVVDKPAGVPSHPLEPGEKGTVANALVARFPECLHASKDPREAGLCHRLDVDTSGALLAARTPEAWTKTRAEFSARRVDKRYWTLVAGPILDEGEIDLPLRHAPRRTDRVEPATGPGREGREAHTAFRVLDRTGEWALLEVKITTGVLHQIRAHLAAIGAPVVGDALYGGRPEPGLSRFFLHACLLGVAHPTTGARIEVQSPLPSELREALARHALMWS